MGVSISERGDKGSKTFRETSDIEETVEEADQAEGMDMGREMEMDHGKYMDSEELREGGSLIAL